MREFWRVLKAGGKGRDCDHGDMNQVDLEKGGRRLHPRRPMIDLKNRARIVRRDVHALYLASRDPRVPWYVKAIAVVVAGYALSPIDLIPDFIPVLGYLDEVILLPLGILLVVRLIPPAIMAEHRLVAGAARCRPVGRVAALVISCIWIASIALCGWLVAHSCKPS